MSCERENIKKKIDRMQDLLNKSLEKEKPLSNHILRISQKLDELIIEYIRKVTGNL